MLLRYGLAISVVTAFACSASNEGSNAKKPTAARADSGTKSAASKDASAARDASATRDASTTGDAGDGVVSIKLPDGAPGIGFDDLQWASGIHKVLAPAGRSGNLDLVDPDTLAVTAVSGFSKSDTFASGSHAAGSTSAAEGSGVVFALDHESQSIKVVDPATHQITGSAAVTGGPDYIRFVKPTGELWVTEPFTGIVVFSISASGAPEQTVTLPVTGGPEAIVVDGERGRVYTNSFTGQTYAIEITTRAVVETWPNGCGLSLGLALDEKRGFLFVACMAGSIVVLDAANGGTKLGELQQGSGLDVISYDPLLHHLYVQGSTSADLAIVAISATGQPTLLGTVPTAKGSSTSTTDENGHVFVADPTAGALLMIRDTFPKTE